MEADNHHSSAAGDDFEQVNANNPDAEQQCAEKLMIKILRELGDLKSENKLLHEKNNTLVAKVDSLHLQLLANNREVQANNREMQARLESMEQKLKIAELETKFLAKQQEMHTENDLFKAENEKLKTEKQQLLEKSNLLESKVEALQTQIGELQAKQRVVELEVMAKEQMDKAIEAKMSEETAKLKEQRKNLEEVQLKFEEKLQSLKNEMAEKDKKAAERLEEQNRKTVEDTGKLEKQLSDVEAMLADKEREVVKVRTEFEKMAKQLEEVSTEWGEKLIDSQNKLKEMQKLMEMDALNLIKLGWSNNKWHISDQKIVHANGLTIVKTIENANRSNVRTQHPVSCALLALIPADQKLVYWEVLMKKESASDIGWVGPNFSLNDECIGYHPDSFAITRNGNYWESGCYFGGHGKGFGIDDVVGSGLLLTREGRPKLFFTLNGRLNGEPIVLKESPDRLLFPAVTLYYKDTSVEVNFGADLENKPFKFDVKAHVTELFD